MSIPYTYFIKWSKTGIQYYGVRYCRNCCPSDLWTTYFTSSKYVKEYRKLHGEPDIIQIRKVFDTKEKAIIFESKFLKKVNAVKRNDFLNKTDGKAISYNSHPKGMLGKKHTSATKEKMRGRKWSEKDKELMSKNRSGKNHWNYGNKWSDDVKEKNRLSNIKKRKENPELFTNPPSAKDRKHSEETKKKISEARKLYWEKKRNSSPK